MSARSSSASAITARGLLGPGQPRHGVITVILVLVCFMLRAETGWGQDSTAVFERIPPEIGLSQNSISAIIQDRRGFLWVGTNEGLNRYDGYRFISYRHDPQNPNSLSDNRVQSLLEDRQGNLWTGTTAGAERLDPRTGRFAKVAIDDQSLSTGELLVWRILEDSHGTIWLSTSAGVCRVDPDRMRGHVYQNPQPGNTLRRLYEDASGALWLFGSSPTEAYRYNPRLDGFQPVDLRAPAGWAYSHWTNLYEDRTGTLWVPGQNRLAVLDLSTRRLINADHLPADTTIWEDARSLLWLADSDVRTRGRPNVGTAGLWRHLQLDLSASSALTQIRTVYQDRAGTVWAGTLGGLYRWDPYARHFRHRTNDPSNPSSLSSNVVSAIHEDSRGFLWVGTIGGGLNRLIPRTDQVVRFRHDSRNAHSLSNDVVWALHEDQRGRLWIGTDDGLNMLDLQSGRFRVARCRERAGDLPNSVSSIVEDRDGTLWLGLYKGSLARFDPRSWTCQLIGSSKLSTGSTLVSIDSFGSIWIGLEGLGLQRFDSAARRFKNYQLNGDRPGTSSDRTIWAIHHTPDGPVWLGTDLGLIKFDPAAETFVRFWDPALPSSVVYAIVEDADHKFWLSTNNGICNFDPKAPSGQQFVSFSTADGLRNAEFNRRAAVRARNGELFFGGLQGLTSFDPVEILRQNPIAPPVVVTEVEASNREGLRTLNPLGVDKLALSYSDYSFSFAFVALGFTNSTRNRYAYMLEGFDPGWVGPSSRRIAQYTNVPPGTYVFRVKGSNNDGVWNQEGVSLRLTITPPFWHRWWFRGLTLGAIACLLLLAHRYRVRQILAIERIRRQVATDLHDDVGSGLSQVAILSEVAKREAAPAAAALMTETANLARSMRESLGDIVWAVDPRQDRLTDLIYRMRQVAANSLESDGVRVEFRAPADDAINRIGLPPDRRRHLLLLFKEATTNIVRHAEASHVSIDLKVRDRILTMTIDDDGRGFDTRRSFPGHGLRSMAQRTSELAAQFDIESTPGAGTTIRVDVPLG